MASGPEHFKAAEELIAGVEQYGGDMTPEGRAGLIAIAQVHAPLASAAATALTMTSPDGSYCPADEDAWHRVAGTVAQGAAK